MNMKICDWLPVIAFMQIRTGELACLQRAGSEHNCWCDDGRLDENACESLYNFSAVNPKAAVWLKDNALWSVWSGSMYPLADTVCLDQ